MPKRKRPRREQKKSKAAPSLHLWKKDAVRFGPCERVPFDRLKQVRYEMDWETLERA